MAVLKLFYLILAEERKEQILIHLENLIQIPKYKFLNNENINEVKKTHFLNFYLSSIHIG